MTTAVLQGVVGDEGCADVVQLLGQQKKNGVLRLRSRYGAIDISMGGGLITRVEDISREDKNKLGQLLVRAGLLGEAQLAEALAEQRRTRRRLGELLLEKGFVTSQAVAETIRLQTRESLFNAFVVRKGTYEFVPGRRGQAAPELDGGMRWEVAVMEGGRRVAEWPLIHEVLPNTSCALRIVAALPEQPIEYDGMELDGELDAESVRLQRLNGFPSESERLVYALIVPGSTVQSVIDQSRLGDFEAQRAAWRLVLAKCVEAHSDLDGIPEVDAEPLEGDDTAQRDLVNMRVGEE